MSPLQTELALPAYAALSDQAAADLLNTPRSAGRKMVAMSDIKPLLYTDATPCAMLRLQDAANTAPNSPDTQVTNTAARTILMWLNDPHIQNVNLDDKTASGAIEAITLAGILSQELIAKVNALGNIMQTRAQQIHFPRAATAADVAAARKK